MTQDITALPQSIKDFIQRHGHSLNPLCWVATYQYPKEAKAFTPEQTSLHMFVLDSDGQLSLLRRHEPSRRGIVYELGPRDVHGAPKPAKPRINLEKSAPVLTADIPDTLPPGTPGVDDFDNPDYFAQLQYYYPDDSTGVITDYLISTSSQTFQAQLYGSTGKLSLYGPEQIHYQAGTPVTADQWQQCREALQQACDLLSEQRRQVDPMTTWPRTVQPLHLINTEILHPGNSREMDRALFTDDGHPLASQFSIAEEVWQRKFQRSDVFTKRFKQQQDIEPDILSSRLGQSFGLAKVNIYHLANGLIDLIYLLADNTGWQPLQALQDIATQLSYTDPHAWVKEAALAALLSRDCDVRSQDKPGNRSPYYECLSQIGEQLHQFAQLQRQQEKVLSVTGQHNCPLRKTLVLPEIGSNWGYQPSKNLSQPKRILRIGLFFDGTGQDRYNDERLPDRDISNVAKLHDLYLEQTTEQGNEIITTRAIYIPGVGTITGRETDDGFKAKDSKIGLGLGMGKTGGYARIELALGQINEHLNEQEYDEVIFDVFGFSRGAALSRHFVNLINEWPEQLTIWELKYRNPLLVSILPVEPVKRQVSAFPQHLRHRVHFVALWDTVGSFGWPADERNLDFNLNLNAHSAERVMHIVSAHEIRHNFPSTRLADASGRLPANFTEIMAPGVHCDVGAGYENPTGKGFENWEVIPVQILAGCNDGGLLLRAKQREIEARGHYANAQGFDIIEEIRKATFKELACYPLHTVIDAAKNQGVPLRPLTPDDSAYVIPDRLQRVYDMWQQAGGQMKMARQFLIEYIHTSERDGDIVDRPNLINGQKARQVFYNHSEQAVTVESNDAKR
ncbi:T6SS phospholipase effector Tle1-like catalytic domain-containing protein [Gynuella sunshinyii]|uniref:T6SS Phospholipase effector Tle1-like catalytic domain-containing protein n=1 Tax=Gynuella sunshinyii YC6258 TaxID=1445510 RepID=A0A0C5VSD0_9GAMM|nr:DUF2235 domain-containing protein [Gynuella sunshinyii]AJQ97126.1 hypothetical protein YC6258_05096 [Gynuella sunshinyii YC6258]